MVKRAAAFAATCAALLALASCPRPRANSPQVTGTCAGACDYYQACKRSDDSNTYQACVSECTEFFSDRQALVELERLECDELVGFIEGPNGRAPGQR